VLKRILSFLRPAIVLVAVFMVVGLAGVAYQGIRTLQQLKVVEAGRDQWQRPADIIQALNLKSGNVVVDFGSGSGYFALKLSDAVGSGGQVLAVDLRRLSLLFLRIRALLGGRRNLQTIVGSVDDPHLASGTVDAVLIANTYHELTAPEKILAHLSRALRPGGRLVIVDRKGSSSEHHQAVPPAVEAEVRKAGFSIVSRNDEFIHPAGDESWWLLVADRP
jgi:ubiquinone/menaquinone biosynthesis C-methylase UbiE